MLITTAALTLKQYISPFPLVSFIPLAILQLCSNRMFVVISLFVGIFMTCVYGMGATLKIALPVAIIVSDCYQFAGNQHILMTLSTGMAFGRILFVCGRQRTWRWRILPGKCLRPSDRYQSRQ